MRHTGTSATTVKDVTQIFASMVQAAPPRYRAAVLRLVAAYQSLAAEEIADLDPFLAQLDQFLLQDERPHALLLAPTGRGKTTLLLHWLARLATTSPWHIIFAPISLRYQTASANATLRALTQALATIHGDREYQHVYNVSPDQLRPILASYVRTPPPAGLRLLLAIDGLDETVGWSVGKDVFADTPGPMVRILATARYVDATTPQQWLERLGWNRERTFILVLEPPSEHMLDAMLQRMLSALEPHRASDTKLRDRILQVSQGDPLTMRLLAEAVHQGRIDADLLPHLQPGLEGYIEFCLSEWFYRHRDFATALALFPRLCAIALGPLSTMDLLHLAPDVFDGPATVKRVAHVVSEFIDGDGSDDHGYAFRHLRFREIFRERIFTEEELHAVEQRFVHYGLRWYEGQTFVRKRARTMAHVMESQEGLRIPDYVRRYWIAHLREAGEWGRMRRILTDIVSVHGIVEQPWAAARFAIEGHYAGYLSDLDILWRWAEHQYDIVLGMRCALIAGSIRSQKGNLLPGLLAGLATVGTPTGPWSGELVMRQMHQMASPRQKVKALEALAGCPPDQLPYDAALDLVQSFASEEWRSEALAVLTPHLPPQLQERALGIARAMRNEQARSRALTVLIPILPPQRQQAIFAEALEAARTIEHEEARAQALLSLLPVLPPHARDMVEELFEAVCWLRLEVPRAEAILALALHPTASAIPHLVREALGVARNAMRKGQMTEALKVIATHLPPEQQHEYYVEALEAVLLIAHNETRALALHALAPYLPPPHQPFARDASLEAALAIASPRQRLQVVSILAPTLPPERKTLLLDVCWRDVWSLEDITERLSLLQLLAPHLPREQQIRSYLTIRQLASAIDDQRQRATILVKLAEQLASEPAEQLAHEHVAVCRDALQAIRMVTDELERSALIIALAPHLPTILLADTLATIRTIRDGWQRAEALVGVIPYVPVAEQPLLYGEALAASRAIGDELSLARCLIALLPHSPETRHHEFANSAIQLISGFADEQQRIRALLAAAPYCAPSRRQEHYLEAMTAGFAIADPKIRSDLLHSLIPQLPGTLLPHALAMAQAIPDPWYRFEALRVCAPLLPAREQLELYREMLTLTQTALGEWQQSEALHALATMVPITLHADMLGAILTIRHEFYRHRALLALIPSLAAPLVPKAFTVVQEMEQERWKSEALMAIIPRLPAAMIPSALDIAHSLLEAGNRARVLQVLAMRLPEPLQAEVCRATLEATQKTTPLRWRADVLVALAPHLPDALLPEALALANAMKDRVERVRVLVAYAPRVPERILGEVVSDTCAISDEWERANALIALAPVLPTSRIPEVLAAARMIHSPQERARALMTLAGLVPASQQPRLYAEALAACRAIPSDSACAVALCKLAAELPVTQQLEIYAEAFGAVRAIAVEEELRETLAILVEHLTSWTTRSLTHIAAATILWQAAVRFFTTPGRPYLLQHLELLLPWMVRLMDRNDVERVIDMLIEVHRCWP